MCNNKKLFITIAIISMLIIIAAGYKITKQVSVQGEKNKADNYLMNTIKDVNNKLGIDNIEFVSFAAGNGNGFRELILNYNSNYNNSTIGKEALKYSKEYLKTVMKNADVQKLDAVSLYIQLNGVDENGQKPNSPMIITVYLSKLGNINWDTLTIEELQKIATCLIDPTKPV